LTHPFTLLLQNFPDNFHLSTDIILIPSHRPMALGSTQPLVKMSTRNISWGKGSRCVRLTTSPPSCAECHGNLGV